MLSRMKILVILGRCILLLLLPFLCNVILSILTGMAEGVARRSMSQRSLLV